jgi:hypothetical protein
LQKRLQQLADTPDWAAYLPARLQQELHIGDKLCSQHDRAGSASCSVSSQGVQSPVSYWWRGRIWALSRDPAGCREVQRMLDTDSEAERVALAKELRGHVHEAMRCPHANYVLQKVLSTLRPEQLCFIVEELESKGPAAVAQVARHKYGCRIVQRLLEHCSQPQAERVIGALFADVVGNCIHPYGNYAMQKVLEHGPAEERRGLIDALCKHVATLGSDTYGSSVLAKALACGSREEQLLLVRAMLATPGLLLQMSRTRRGNTPARVALKLLEGDELEEAKLQLGCRQDQRDQPWLVRDNSSGFSMSRTRGF